MIVIIDYGMGNLGSILNMLKKIGAPAVISSDAREIENADKLILPGVGAFDTGMKRLNELGMMDLLNDKVLRRKTPTLGVCLGMQLLMKRSDEGAQAGLGWIDGETIRFQFDPKEKRLKIPHMGWNTIAVKQDGALVQNMTHEPRFYFVHSYHVVCHQPNDVVAMTDYGYEFPSILQHENIVGAQFHPEKSHRFGMQIYKNFVEWTC
jgi:imidazole glycerol-phosphate synthase subunit HisH